MIPGSPSAKAFGCLCSEGDNAHIVYGPAGLGRQYIIVEACPMHGVIAWNVPKMGPDFNIGIPTSLPPGIRVDIQPETTTINLSSISPAYISKNTDNYKLVRSKEQGLQLLRERAILDEDGRMTGKSDWITVPIEDVD